MASFDRYIMIEDIEDTYKYINGRFNNIHICIDGIDYATSIKIFGDYISDKGLLIYYGKVFICNSERPTRYIHRSKRMKICRKLENKIKKRNSDYSMYIDSNYNFSVLCKKRLSYSRYSL